MLGKNKILLMVNKNTNYVKNNPKFYRISPSIDNQSKTPIKNQVLFYSDIKILICQVACMVHISGHAVTT